MRPPLSAVKINRKNSRFFLQAVKVNIYLPRYFRSPVVSELTLLDISPSGACFEISEKIKIPKKATIDIYFSDAILFSLKCSIVYIQKRTGDEQYVLGVEFIDPPQKLKDTVVKKSLLSKIQNIDVKSQFCSETESKFVHRFTRSRIEYTVIFYPKYIEVWMDDKHRKEKTKTTYVNGFDEAGKAMPLFLANIRRDNKIQLSQQQNDVEVEDVPKRSCGALEITSTEAKYFGITYQDPRS